MEKLMESVSRLDVIKAITLMDNPRNLKVIHIRNNKWSDDNSKQIEVIVKSVVGRIIGRYKIASREGIEVFPPGYYVCTFNEVLDGCEYSIEVEYQLKYRLQGITETAYLYYIGQDKY